MDAKHSAVDNCSQSEIIKYLTTPPPHVAAAVFALAFVVEPVNLCNLPRLMVPANKSDTFGISDLQCKQEEERFDAVKAPINKIACSDC